MLKLTGGDQQGRALKWLDIPEIRPTPARVREALCNILSDRLPQAVCWDLCAGSGGVGLEFLSRGAAEVSFIVHNRRAMTLVRQNIRDLGWEKQTRFFQGDLVRFLKLQKTLTPDLIYCDPPYDGSLYQKSLAHLAELPLANERCLLIIEYRRRKQSWQLLEPWVIIDERTYGDTCLAFLERTK